MNKGDRLLQAITDETKNSINGIKVLTPAIYTSILTSSNR